MNLDNDYTMDDSGMDIPEYDHPLTTTDGHEMESHGIIHQIMHEDNALMPDDYYSDSDLHNATPHNDISFGAKYSDAEIQKMESDVDMAEHEMKCRENDMNNWRSKVSLNDTKEHRANGDYDNAVRHFNEAQSKYNTAVGRYNSALSKLNNAR